MYSAEISRMNPTCFLFLVDHSTSMQNPIMGIAGNPKKSEFVADALNKVIQSLVVSASKDMEIRKYYQVGVLGYGFEVKSALGGELANTDLVWIDEIYEHPLRIEDRIKKESDGVGGFIEVSTKFPVWVDAVSRGQTPMCAALNKAHEILAAWVEEHPQSYPPTLINLTDGEANDGDARVPAELIKSLATEDGNCTILTVHSSSNELSRQIVFPMDAKDLPDHFSRVMFKVSSPLTPKMRATSEELMGTSLEEGARGLVYNADIAGIVQALEIGTRPANIQL
ncbi:MAG TPA: hypothetical protein DIW44_09160 [Anaerolineaceae bacterium]|nr:hypothetical protein [Anaerolineaceae bacterium]